MLNRRTQANTPPAKVLWVPLAVVAMAVLLVVMAVAAQILLLSRPPVRQPTPHIPQPYSTEPEDYDVARHLLDRFQEEYHEGRRREVLASVQAMFIRLRLDPNGATSSGHSLVAIAAARGESAVVEWLLDEGASVNAASPSDGGSPLQLAVQDEADPETIRLLLDRGADPNCAGGSDCALAIAASRGDVEVMKVLIEAGADPNLTRGTQHPLANAIVGDHYAAAEYLMQQGATMSPEQIALLSAERPWLPLLANRYLEADAPAAGQGPLPAR